MQNKMKHKSFKTPEVLRWLPPPPLVSLHQVCYDPKKVFSARDTLTFLTLNNLKPGGLYTIPCMCLYL